MLLMVTFQVAKVVTLASTNMLLVECMSKSNTAEAIFITYNPEFRPAKPSELTMGTQGLAEADCIAVWFFWWLQGRTEVSTSTTTVTARDIQLGANDIARRRHDKRRRVRQRTVGVTDNDRVGCT